MSVLVPMYTDPAGHVMDDCGPTIGRSLADGVGLGLGERLGLGE
jgi:hypothetical protein